MNQEWGPNWYHFSVEHLPRIMVFLDVLLENEDIMIAVHFHGHDRWHDFEKEYDAHVELLGFLGIERQRIILVMKEVRAQRVQQDKLSVLLAAVLLGATAA